MVWGSCHDAGSTGACGWCVFGAREGTGAAPAGRGWCKGVARGLWVCRAARARACRPGWLRCGHACKVFGSMSGGGATANAGRGRGQELWCRVGEHLGSKGQLQDVVVGCFAAGWSNAHGGGHLHAIGVLGLGLGHGDVWACPERAGGVGCAAGQEMDKHRASLGCHLSIGCRTLFDTIRHYMVLLGFKC